MVTSARCIPRTASIISAPVGSECDSLGSTGVSAGGEVPDIRTTEQETDESRVVQDEKTFTAKKNFVWTCNKDTKEQVFNDGTVVAIMRITDLKA